MTSIPPGPCDSCDKHTADPIDRPPYGLICAACNAAIDAAPLVSGFGLVREQREAATAALRLALAGPEDFVPDGRAITGQLGPIIINGEDYSAYCDFCGRYYPSDLIFAGTTVCTWCIAHHHPVIGVRVQAVEQTQAAGVRWLGEPTAWNLVKQANALQPTCTTCSRVVDRSTISSWLGVEGRCIICVLGHTDKPQAKRLLTAPTNRTSEPAREQTGQPLQAGHPRAVQHSTKIDIAKLQAILPTIHSEWEDDPGAPPFGNRYVVEWLFEHAYPKISPKTLHRYRTQRGLQFPHDSTETDT